MIVYIVWFDDKYSEVKGTFSEYEDAKTWISAQRNPGNYYRITPCKLDELIFWKK